MKLKYIDRPFEVKSVKKDGTFEGYASVFGELDSYRDIVMPGAFAKSLREDFKQKNRAVPMLWQHNSYAPIGIYPVINEDDVGLFVKGACNMEVQQGREAHSLMDQGALSGLSIGYTTNLSEWDEKALTRKLIEVNLWEVSPVTFPAGDSARINSVKSVEGLITLSDVEDYMREAYGCSRKEVLALIARIKKATGPQSESAGESDAESVKKALATIKSIRL